MQVWLQIQSMIETTQADGGIESGSMVDVIKCFNHLPRVPIFEICAHLGIPRAILRGWSNANEAENFLIISEEPVSAGVRRMVAYTGDQARKAINDANRLRNELTKALQLNGIQLIKECTRLTMHCVVWKEDFLSEGLPDLQFVQQPVVPKDAHCQW